MKNREENEKLLKRLEQMPWLMERMKTAMEIVENKNGAYGTADEAEAAAIKMMDALGQELMGGWGQRRADQLADEGQEKGMIGYAKKKSTG